MKQFTLRLDARQQRPVVALKNGMSAFGSFCLRKKVKR